MIVLVGAIGAALTALEAWAAMLLLGGIHSEVPEAPSVSYLGAFWLVLLVDLLVGGAVAGSKAGGK